MNVYDETLIRFDETGKNICINFTQTIFSISKTNELYAKALPMVPTG
jgi:hypothetical protein